MASMSNGIVTVTVAATNRCYKVMATPVAANCTLEEAGTPPLAPELKPTGQIRRGRDMRPMAHQRRRAPAADASAASRLRCRSLLQRRQHLHTQHANRPPQIDADNHHQRTNDSGAVTHLRVRVLLARRTDQYAPAACRCLRATRIGFIERPS